MDKKDIVVKAPDVKSTRSLPPFYEGHEHDQKKLGELIKHRHPCTKCRKTFTHTHFIKSTSESREKYDQLCDACKLAKRATMDPEPDEDEFGYDKVAIRVRGPKLCHACGEAGHVMRDCGKDEGTYVECVLTRDSHNRMPKQCKNHQHRKKSMKKGGGSEEAFSGATRRLAEKQVETCSLGLMCNIPGRHYHKASVAFLNCVEEPTTHIPEEEGEVGWDADSVMESEEAADDDTPSLDSSSDVSDDDEESVEDRESEPESSSVVKAASTTVTVETTVTGKTTKMTHSVEADVVPTTKEAEKEGVDDTKTEEETGSITKWGYASKGHKYFVQEMTILIQGNLEGESPTFFSKVWEGDLFGAVCYPFDKALKRLLYDQEQCLERGIFDGIDLEEISYSNLSKQYAPNWFGRYLFGNDRFKEDTKEARDWRNRLAPVCYGKILKKQLVCCELLDELTTDQVLLGSTPLTDSGQLAAAFFALLRHTASKSVYAPLIMSREPVVLANTIMRAHNVLLVLSLKTYDLRRLTSSKSSDF
jgi:hypothetical protein